MSVFGVIFVISGAVFLVKPSLFARGGIAGEILHPNQYILFIRGLGLLYVLIGIFWHTHDVFGYIRAALAISFLWILLSLPYFYFYNKKRGFAFNSQSLSFSLLVFHGEISSELEGLLQRQEYRIVSKRMVEDRPLALYEALNNDGDQPDLVDKGFFTIKDHTVLMDPEMVLFTNAEDDLRALCERLGIEVFACLWERVSRTVVFLRIDRGGIVEKTMIVPGQKITDNINPNKTIIREPNSQGLIGAMSEAGLPVKEIFGTDTVQATVLTLRE